MPVTDADRRAAVLRMHPKVCGKCRCPICRYDRMARVQTRRLDRQMRASVTWLDRLDDAGRALLRSV